MPRWNKGVGALLAAMAVLLAGAPVRAQEVQAVDLARWKVKEGSYKTSTVSAGALIFRQYSTLRCEDIGLEAAEIRVQAEWLAPLGYVDADLRLHLMYDDQVSENLEGTIPKGTRHHEMVYKPKWAAGRRIQAMELGHGQTGVEFKVTSIKLAVRHTAVTMASNSLGGAQLDANGNLEHDILVAGDSNSPREKLPFLSGVNAPEIRLVASLSCGFPWILEQGTDVALLALGADNSVLKFVRVRLDGNVKSITVPLKDVDLAKTAKLAFCGGGSGVRLAVRQITIGSAPAAALTLKQVNDRLDALLAGWRKGTAVPKAELDRLSELLALYRTLE